MLLVLWNSLSSKGPLALLKELSKKQKKPTIHIPQTFAWVFLLSALAFVWIVNHLSPDLAHGKAGQKFV